jgi:hypothetical protein
MRSWEELIKEYEILEESANSIANRMWQLTGILLVIALGSGFGGLLLVQNNTSSKCGEWEWIAIPIIAILVDLTWLVAWYRERFYLQVTQYRLREISKDMGFKKDWYIHKMDHPTPTSDADESKEEWKKERDSLFKNVGLGWPAKWFAKCRLFRVRYFINVVVLAILIFWIVVSIDIFW